MANGYFFGHLQRIIEEYDLTMNELKLYCKIANLPQGCFAGQKTLAEWLGCTDRSIRNSLSKLVKHGLVEKRGHAYWILPGEDRKIISAKEENNFRSKRKIISDTTIYKESTSNKGTKNTPPKKSGVSKAITAEQLSDYKPRPKLRTYWNEDSAAAAKRWLEWRAERGFKPYTDFRWLTAFLGSIQSFTDEALDQLPQYIAEECINNGWQGLKCYESTFRAYERIAERRLQEKLEALREDKTWQ